MNKKRFRYLCAYISCVLVNRAEISGAEIYGAVFSGAEISRAVFSSALNSIGAEMGRYLLYIDSNIRRAVPREYAVTYFIPF